jgi:epoxyqueuosine reductase QueG
VTILTNAPLKITGKAIEDNCGNCRECIDMCPVGAFTGRPFQKDEKREMRFDAERCEQYLDDLEKTTGLATCGLCIYACPKR